MHRLPMRAPARKAVASARSVSFLSALRSLYATPEWALYTEVRSSTGCCETLRIADALAVCMWGGAWRIHGFELKASRADWLRELRHPEKAAPIKLFCASWFLVVMAPWKRTVMSLTELPDRWGLLEIGTGGASIVSPAAEREAEEPTGSFLRSLLRAAAREPEDLDTDGAGAPRVLVTRPHLSRTHVGLVCGHVAPRPLAKVMPHSLPCVACLEGRPTDRAYIEAALADATEEEQRAYAELISGRGVLLAGEQRSSAA
jgi:hypothetical protein